MKKLLNSRATWLWFIWIVAVVATLGSLSFSEILGWTPCKLCWEQRIFMYPIVIIGIVGYFYRDWKWYRYALPLASIGILFSIYHNLLKWGIIPETCSATGPSCTQGHPWFGFVTIPLMALVAFALIIFGIWQIRRTERGVAK